MSTTPFVMPNDLSDLCRVCLQLPDESQYLDLTTIYDEEDNLSYAECFTICTQIDLSAGEGIPHHLCKSCGLELQMSYDFYKKVEESKRVIQQCQNQIEENKANEQMLSSNEQLDKLNSDLQQGGCNILLMEKYVVSDVEEQITQNQENSVSHGHEQQYIQTSDVDDETGIDIINKMCRVEASTQRSMKQKENTNYHRVESMNDDNCDGGEQVGSEVESVTETECKSVNVVDHLEVEDYQNLEALEEGVAVPGSLSIARDEKCQQRKYIFINRPDFCANVQYFPSLTGETVIEEEISQEATDEWLDTLPDIGVHDIAEKGGTHIPAHEMSQNDEIEVANTSDIPKDVMPDEGLAEEQSHKDSRQTNMFAAVSFAREIDRGPEQNMVDNCSSRRGTALCTICHKTFVNRSKLKWHMRMHDTNRIRFICPVESCGRLYASKQSCDLHYRQTHLDEGYYCSICRKIFSAKQTLEVHMRYHTRDFPYQCNMCDRKFAQKGHLTQHIEVKHQNIRYICTEPNCGKIFQNSVSLKNHHYTHSSMPFKCNRCDKQYPQKNKLKIHIMRKHNLEVSLDELETMRQFKTIRTRHTYVKVKKVDVKESVDDGDSSTDCGSIVTPPDYIEELDVCS